MPTILLIMINIQAIIFDLGKVVFDVSFDRVYRHWAATSGRSFEEIKSRFVFDDIFNRFEKNEISPKQFRLAISDRLGITISDEDFDAGWCDLYLDEYLNMDQFLLNLKSNYRLVALTNTNAIHNDIWRKKYADTLLLFEKIFSSYELKTRKPESRIYEIVLQYLDLKPEQTLFLDDNIDNINGAKNLGLQAILVTSTEQMIEDLRLLGIVV